MFFWINNLTCNNAIMGKIYMKENPLTPVHNNNRCRGRQNCSVAHKVHRDKKMLEQSASES